MLVALLNAGLQVLNLKPSAAREANDTLRVAASFCSALGMIEHSCPRPIRDDVWAPTMAVFSCQVSSPECIACGLASRRAPAPLYPLALIPPSPLHGVRAAQEHLESTQQAHSLLCATCRRRCGASHTPKMMAVAEGFWVSATWQTCVAGLRGCWSSALGQAGGLVQGRAPACKALQPGYAWHGH